jgi:chromate transport protein ChrA
MSEAGPPPDNIEPAPAPTDPAPQVGFMRVLRYFVRLGTIGFGGPIATVGYMQRDLVEHRGWIDRRDFLDGVALGQTMPGPLAAQVAMWVGYLRKGAPGALAVALAFIAPSFLLVVAVGALYARYSGLPVVAALFYGIAPAVMAIITIAAVKLVKLTDRRDWRLWVISATVFGLTAATGSEPILVILGAGLLMIGLDARPKMRRPRRRSTPVDPEQGSTGDPPQRSAAFPFVMSAGAFGAIAGGGTLVALGVFFLKTGAVVFGSGLAIVPFLRDGVVAQHYWLTQGPVPRRGRDGTDHPRPGGDHRRVHRLPRRRSARRDRVHRRDLHPDLPRRGRARPLVPPPPRQLPNQGVRIRGHRRRCRRPVRGGRGVDPPSRHRLGDRIHRPGHPRGALAVQSR